MIPEDLGNRPLRQVAEGPGARGVTSKIARMPENARNKMQETLGRVVNEGSGGLICIIL
jgi:hypothetical protein